MIKGTVMRNLLIVSAVVVAIGVAFVAQAGDGKPDPKITAKIEAGLKAYKDGKHVEATAALQEALAMIQKASASGLESFFPAAPAGWEAQKVDSNTMSMTGQDGKAFSFTTLTREYKQKKDGGQRLTMSLLVSSEMVGMQKQGIEVFITNPEMLKMLNAEGGTAKALKQDGWSGLLRAEKGGEATALLFSNSIMLNVTGDVDAAMLEKFIKSIDLKGLAAQDKSGTEPAKPAEKKGK